MPQLLDPNFKRAVVLLIHHDDTGTFGLVLNRATPITAPTLCETLEIDWGGRSGEVIDWGGPVQPQTGWLLFDEESRLGPDEEVTDLGSGVCFAGSLDVLRQLAEHPPGNLRLMLGYAGWGPGQLESELTEGAWITAPLTPEIVFDVDAESMWETAVRGLGIEPATLVPTRGVH